MFGTKRCKAETVVTTTEETRPAPIKVLDYPVFGELVKHHLTQQKSGTDWDALFEYYQIGEYGITHDQYSIDLWIAVRQKQRQIEPGVLGFTAFSWLGFKGDIPLAAHDAYMAAKDDFGQVLVLRPGVTERQPDPIMIGLRKDDPTLYMIAHWD